ncbi:endonuclease domain-containing protein [Actinoplanes sp. NPDC051494]|uniref:endonuclease domain-containing protein n=1 Tax=Actinoplanes sp. NPDC051494 TaxID=3363907 RepID=UPI0037B08202
MAQAWKDLPLDRPISIEGPGAAILALSIETLPPGAPAIIVYAAAGERGPAPIIASLLALLDRSARELFPVWLPQARHLDGPAGAGVTAARSMALRTAERHGHYGPFLADLAERAVTHRTRPGSRLSDETRATGLARIIAASFDRPRTALLVRVPDALPPVSEQALVAAAQWFCDAGAFGAWFTGAPLHATDTVERVPLSLPAAATLPPAEPLPAGSVRYPAIAGHPHPASRAEQLLEAALRTADWAAGREWNQPHQVHPLTSPVRLDLLWRAERCVVEIDGPEHRQADQFAGDRQRDVLLQLHGYAVLRFTNDQVTQHCDLVLSQIRQLLVGRRAGHNERSPHV